MSTFVLTGTDAGFLAPNLSSSARAPRSLARQHSLGDSQITLACAHQKLPVSCSAQKKPDAVTLKDANP